MAVHCEASGSFGQITFLCRLLKVALLLMFHFFIPKRIQFDQQFPPLIVKRTVVDINNVQTVETSHGLSA
jgi:hypothetical protein